METLISGSEYIIWIKNIKLQIKQTQIKAATSVNHHLIMLYWNLGKQITEQQKLAKWGSGFIKQVSDDLKNEFPDVGGFSEYNLRMCRKFYSFYNQEIKDDWEQPVPKLFADKSVKWEQLVPKIPWGHHILILKKNKIISEALFYVSETIKNNWSRAVLEYQIETDLYNRQGKAISNFEVTLPKEDSDLAQQILKDPYNFIVDFSLKDVNKPIGVSEFTYTELPKEIKNALPSDEEFKNQLSKLEDEKEN